MLGGPVTSPSPRLCDAKACTAAFASPSDEGRDRPRVRRRAPNVCALMMANVPDIWGPGEGEREGTRECSREGGRWKR